MKYFSIEELCHTNTGLSNKPSPDIENKLRRFVELVLDPLREEFGRAIRVNSGYRNDKVNRLVGGKVSSQHLKGEAVDISAGSKTLNKELFNLIKNKYPFDQLIWERGGAWIHLSWTENRALRQQVLSIK